MAENTEEYTEFSIGAVYYRENNNVTTDYNPQTQELTINLDSMEFNEMMNTIKDYVTYKGNLADTLMAGISGIFGAVTEGAKQVSEQAIKQGFSGKIKALSFISQAEGISVSATYNYGNNGRDITKAAVAVSGEIILSKGISLILISTLGLSSAPALITIGDISAITAGILMNTQAGKVGVQWASEKIKPLITNIESKIRDFFNRFDSNPSSYELVKNPSLESKDYKSLIELLLDNHSTAQDIDTLLHSFPNYLKVDSKDSTPLDSTIEFYLKESLLKPDKVNAHRKGEIHFTFQILNEDATTPISNAEIQLQNVNLGVKAITDSKGLVSFSIKENEYLKPFRARINHLNYYSIPISDRSSIPNSIRRREYPFILRFNGKYHLYFNGEELYCFKGNKTISYYTAYSGNALSLKEKESLKEQYKYERFVSYKEKDNNISYFCLDKDWQRQKDKGAMFEREYYINLQDIKDNVIRDYENTFFFKNNKKEDEKQYEEFKIPIYTDENCTNTIESNTNRDNFYLHGGKGYGDNGGIDLGGEYKRFFLILQRIKNEIMINNYVSKDEPIIIKLLADYTPLTIHLDSIGLERVINKEISQHKVILHGNYTKPESMHEENFHIQKMQTLWAYQEILENKTFNSNEVKIKDLTFFQKAQRDYKGENLEINLEKYDWHHYEKQIIVFGFLENERSVNGNGEEVLKNPKYRIITWHNPIVNPRATLFSSSGNFNPSIAMFGNIKDRASGIHKALDFFAPIGTKIYAPIDCEVIGMGDFPSYGKTINLKVTESSLEILKIRREYFNYLLAYKNEGEEMQGKDFDEEAESYYLFYAHLSEINVAKGDKVYAGQVIGLSGTTGNARGTKAPHLHFEIRSRENVESGSLKYLVNPALYIKCKKLDYEFTQEEKQEQQEICGRACKLPKE